MRDVIKRKVVRIRRDIQEDREIRKFLGGGEIGEDYEGIGNNKERFVRR